MEGLFYDIESFENIFTLANFNSRTDHIDIYYLPDDPSLISDPKGVPFEKALLDRIYERNQNFRGTIKLFDLRLRSSNEHLAKVFGLSSAYVVNDPNATDSMYPKEFRPVCDTDPDYDEEKHPYLCGYNSNNYDLTMLAEYLYEVFQEQHDKIEFVPTSAAYMRAYNDDLFLDKFKEQMPQRLIYTIDMSDVSRYGSIQKRRWLEVGYSSIPWKIRKNMLQTGRHIDISCLNEKQRKVALKRLLGRMGYQILESEKLSQKQAKIDNTDQLLDMLAYNVSDVVNLHKLSGEEPYAAQFELKKNLLLTYPDIVYDKKKGSSYEPDIRPEAVRRDRLIITSSSAQFATKTLCPYGHLKDIRAVSFMYPSENKAKELGIKRVNVLEQANTFFKDHFEDPALRSEWDRVYRFYKSIEGKNFNDSENYQSDYKEDTLPVNVLAKMPKENTCLFYYNADGTPSTGFVTFSTGGIHGAEYNKALYEDHRAKWEADVADMEYVKSVYPDPLQAKAVKEIIMPDGRVMKTSSFLKSGSTRKNASYNDLSKKEPILFVQKDKGWSINKKYVYTSADLANHEDFTSYYPNLLRMMEAFLNEGLGKDRYAEIFDNKQRYGVMMKDKSYSKPEQSHYKVLREGTKLILNAASGAADATFENNIRVNNQIISMRIIGQLFSWMIGQAQTIAGAKIISTNTDGLYSVMEEKLNNEVLARESANIGVEIEPEPLYLISKDTNNRIEMNPDTGVIIGANGGTVGCRRGPNAEKALDHPAIIDWALSEYLIVSALKYKPSIGLDMPFDRETGMNILLSAKDKFDGFEFMRMFQNVLASSTGSISYIFGTTDEDPATPIILQHYNRSFILKDKTPGTMHLRRATGSQITPAMLAKRKKNDERIQQHDMFAMDVLTANGVQLSDLGREREATIKKVTGVEDSWYNYILNKDLHYVTDEELSFIYDNIDYEKYLTILADCFEANWMNVLPACA